MRVLARSIAAALLIAACSPKVGPSGWERMSNRQRLIYVRSMIGHERVKARKGGNLLHYNLTPEQYVRRIDAAYSRGDRRTPVVIFEEMGTR